jgi:hypothetical protein
VGKGTLDKVKKKRLMPAWPGQHRKRHQGEYRGVDGWDRSKGMPRYLKTMLYSGIILEKDRNSAIRTGGWESKQACGHLAL